MSDSNDQRIVQLHSGALSGKDMVAVSLSGTEVLSELFSFTVELSAAEDNIDADSILGEETSLLLKPVSKTGEERYINGYVTEFTSLGMDTGGDARYHAVISPKLWFSGRAQRIRTHCFEAMKVKDIYDELLAETGIDYKILANESGSAINFFQIQHNESDLDFILRLLAEAGISFFFKHSASGHQMVLVNSAAMYTKKTGKLRFTAGATPFADEETIMGWRRQYQCFAPKAIQYDYDNKKQETLEVEQSSKTKNRSMQKMEVSAFGQGFPQLETADSGLPLLPRNQADAQAKSALRRQQGDYVHINAASDCVSLSAGTIMALKETPAGGGNNFIITSITHSVTTGTDTGTSYRNEIVCIPDQTEIAPPLLTRHAVYGSLPAKVIESEYGEASPVRDYGAVKVAFPWEPDTTSPWLQVSQFFGSGGGESGSWFLPQIDDDVLVSFLGGDTRRPVVVGVMHNGKAKGPLFTNGDAEFTRSGIKTPIGHELSFTDKAGVNEPEEVYLESAGNFDRIIEKNETADIKIDQEITVGEKITIEAGTSIELKVGDNTILVDQQGIHIKGMNFDAKADMEAKIEGLNFTAKGSVNTKVEGTISEFSGSGTNTVKGGMVMIN